MSQKLFYPNSIKLKKNNNNDITILNAYESWKTTVEEQCP